MAMPQEGSNARLSGQVSEARRNAVASEDRQWLKGLFSGRYAAPGKLVAVAAIALLRGRRGRLLLWRLSIGSTVFVYNYLTVVEIIIGFLFIAQVAAKVLPLFTFSKGGDRTGPNRALRQNEKIQSHLQQLAMAAAEAETANSGAANVAPSLHYHCERVTVEYPERNGTTLAVISSTTRNSPAASALTVARQAKSNPGSTDFSTRARSQPHKCLQEKAKLVVIHFQLPVYVCDLTFWNDIHITVSSSSPPPRTVAGKSSSNTTYHPSTSTSALVCQIKMRMWMEMNRDLIAGRTQNYVNPCKDCSTSSHSVGKRRFDCSYLGSCPDGHLDVQKNTFHAGRKLTILGSSGGLNFKFETALEPTLAGPRSNAAAIQQRVTFTLLSQTSRPSSKIANQQEQSSKVDRVSILDERHGRCTSALLAFLRRKKTAHSTSKSISKCSVEAHYAPEDRRIITKN